MIFTNTYRCTRRIPVFFMSKTGERRFLYSNNWQAEIDSTGPVRYNGIKVYHMIQKETVWLCSMDRKKES